MQSCAPPATTPVPSIPGPASCGPGVGGATACGNGPATMGNQSGTNVGAGNPINVINGNKYQREVDMPALPGVLGLEIVRHYNSAYSTPHTTTGILGRGWKLSYETDLYAIGRTIQIIEADGTRIIFNRDPDDPSTCSSANPANGRLQIIHTSRGDEYVWTWVNGRVLGFNSDGKLVQIAAPTGEFVSLLRDAKGFLQQVTDPQGRQLRLHYQDRATASKTGGFGGVVSITSPVGVFGYRYGSVLPAGAAIDKASVRANLVEVSYPLRGSGHLYQYEDARHPTFLSGISVIEEQADKTIANRIGTYLYDRDGKAILTVRGVPARLQTGSDGKPLEPARLAAGTGIGQVALDYSAPGLTVISNSLGQKTTFRHAIIGGESRLLEVRGAGCHDCGETNVRYGYDGLGRLTETTRLATDGAPVKTTRTVLDNLGRPLAVQLVGYRDGKPQPPRMLVRYDYGAGNFSGPRLIARPSVVPGKEHHLQVDYNKRGQPTRVTETGYDPVLENGQISASAAPATARVTTYQYQEINGRSLLVGIDGPLQNGPTNSPLDSDITRLAWSADGSRLEQITYPTGRTARFAYEQPAAGAAFRLVSSTAIDGVVTELKYDASGAVAEVIRAGAVTHYRHDASGRTTQVVAPNGQDLQFAFDGSQQIASIADRQNNRIRLIRDSEGALVEARLFDPNGNLAQQPRRFESPGATPGDAGGAGGAGDVGGTRDAVLAGIRQLIASAKDADNVALARPELTVSPYRVLQDFIAAARAAAETPPRKALDVATDASGFVTSYLTNDFGDLIAVQSPITGNTRYRYDLAGRLLGRTNGDGSHAEYVRDPAGRVIAVQAVDARGHLDENATITWGRADKPVRITYLAGEEAFNYDDGVRLITHVQTLDNKRYRLHYRYDNAGNLVEKTLPNGQVLSYRYRGAVHPRAGLLESVWLKQFKGSIANDVTGALLDRPIVQGMNDAADNYSQRSARFGNGLTNAMTLDFEGRVTTAGNPEIGQTRLHYDNATNPEYPDRVATLHAVPPGRQADQQTTQALISRLHGAITAWRGSPVEQSPVLFALSGGESGPSERHFDAQGRQTRAGNAQYRYDSLSRLAGIDRTVEGVSREVARYRYNLFGQRIAKTVVLSDGKSTKTTHYLYDGSHLVFESAAETGGVGASSAPAAKQYVWLNDTPIAMLQQGQLLAIHTDHRNAPLALTDESRRVVWQANVADFLQASPANGPAFGQITLNLRGSNQYYDQESGLHYNTHRYFDPVAARYLTPDPLGLAAGPDLYAFALNRPQVMSDPLGLAPIGATDWSKASYSEKLSEIIGRSIPLVPEEIGASLQIMVQPENLAAMGAIFTVWAYLQTTVFGWIADAAILGLSYYALGSGTFDLFRALMTLHQGAKTSACDSEIDDAAKTFAQQLVSATAKLISGGGTAAGLGAQAGRARIAAGIEEVIGYAKNRSPLPQRPASALAPSATSAADALRLKTQLAFQEAGILDQNLRLTKNAVDQSLLIQLKGDLIKNPDIVKILTRDGSQINDWRKFTTTSVKMPNDQFLQIHYYKNTKTGAIDYLTYDFKVKGVVQP